MTSSQLKSAAYKQFTSEVLLPLISISAPGIDTLRICPNNEDVISGGLVYAPFPISLQLPDEGGDTVPMMKFAVSAIAQEVVQRLRLVQDALFVDVKMVLFSQPSVIEMQFPTMRLRNITFDAETVSGDLVMGDFLTETVPVHSFTPGFAPAVFKGN